MMKIFQYDSNKLDQLIEHQLSFTMLEATSMKILLEGIIMLDTLGIVKHEHRRILLGRIKSGIVDKENVRLNYLLDVIDLYPTKIMTPAYEMLVELAVKKCIEKQMLTKMDSIFLFHMYMTR